MTKEQQNQLIKYEWDKFCRRYPVITAQTWLSRLMLVFRYKGDLQFMLWENGFLQGWVEHDKYRRDKYGQQ